MNELLEILREAVEDAYEGADESAVSCSGGLDSSTVACLAAETDDDAVQLYTGWYRVPGFDERQYARLVPGWHHEVEITPHDFVEVFDDLALALSPPFQGMGAFGQYVVAEMMAEAGVRVVLSGEGADELFGGYARIMKVAGEPLPVNFPDAILPDDYPDELRAALEWEGGHLLELLECDRQILAAHGLEGRAPFTDSRVLEYALALSPGHRVGKKVLRDAVRGVVPDAIIDRTDKMGFPAPLVAWAQEEPVRSFSLDRVGYVPDVSRPWDRTWWYAMLNVSRARSGVSVWTTGEEGVPSEA